ncbi:MAG: hypothetical protein ACRDFX_12065, partial [Chloroflexota bacterium]
YPELLVFGPLAMLLASHLGMTSSGLGKRVTVKRQIIYGLWGLAVGLGIWSDPLMLPFAIMSGLLLLGTCRRELGWHAIVALALGFILGITPVLAYNVSVTPSQGTVEAVLSIMRAGGSGHTGGSPASVLQRFFGLVAVSIPVITGGNGVCSLSWQNAWPLSQHSSQQTITCTAIHVMWGVGWLACLFLAVVSAVFSLASLRSRKDAMHRMIRGADIGSARYLARLALLGTAVLTIFLFMLTSAPAHAPWANVRYLSGLWIAFPAILAHVIRGHSWRRACGAAASRLVRYGIALLLGIALASNVIGTYADASYSTWLHRQVEAAAAILAEHHVKHVYADYWSCDWLAFETHEAVTCAVIDTRLRPGLDRYPGYRAAVIRDRGAWYVFRADLPQAATYNRTLAHVLGRYRRISLSAFTFYEPLASAQP